ncbi:unnamed protein product [Cyclocybe aegerita]|uniref:PEBP-like protein n=1 Tax=Cyclocybe aegerita TaxID=1973307 RepID=A0A8S0WLQ6_CYCAE|nr:unnamed protein product [Cyclocybe aegerita]
MRLSSALVSSILALAPLVLGQDASLDSVRQAFEAANIPQNLTVTFNPTVLLDVTLPQTSGDPITLSAGLQLPRNATAGPPTFSLRSNASVGTGPFVIASVDPDAPTPQDPIRASIRHFLGGSFVLSGTESGVLANSTPALTEYRGPNPPAGSDPHRYIFLIYAQPAGFDAQTAVTPDTAIANFNLSAFAESTGLGNPIGGTFMVVGPDAPAASNGTDGTDATNGTGTGNGTDTQTSGAARAAYNVVGALIGYLL